MAFLLMRELIRSVKHDNFRRSFKREPFFNTFLGFFFTAISAVFAGISAFAISGAIGYFTSMEEKVEPYNFDIVAVADGSSTDGSFFLFGGSIDEEPVYYFYRQRGGGAITQGYLPTGTTSIHEDSEVEGYVRVNKRKPYCELWRCQWASHKTYEVHVPEGSVVRQFKFDLN